MATQANTLGRTELLSTRKESSIYVGLFPGDGAWGRRSTVDLLCVFGQQSASVLIIDQYGTVHYSRLVAITPPLSSEPRLPNHAAPWSQPRLRDGLPGPGHGTGGGSAAVVQLHILQGRPYHRRARERRPRRRQRHEPRGRGGSGSMLRV